MKHLTQYINEGIFDDNITSAPRINGIEIYMPDWKECQEYYQKRRKKYFWNKTVVYLGDMEDEYKIVYSGDDCLIAVQDDDDYGIYVLCPETIYMNHEAAEICLGRHYVFSLITIEDANDFDIGFCWDPLRGWLNFGAVGSYSSKDEKDLEEQGFTSLTGYMPATISDKAKNIIKKYMK